jgi:hypothetical protein
MSGRLTPPEAFYIALQIASALAAAHEAGRFPYTSLNFVQTLLMHT